MFLLSGPRVLFSLLSVQGKARWKETEILYLAEGQVFSLLESSWKVEILVRPPQNLGWTGQVLHRWTASYGLGITKRRFSVEDVSISL